MNAFEEAQVRQKALYELMETHQYRPNFNWRTFSLLKEYEYKAVPTEGTGEYSVNKETGQVCHCKGEWDEAGQTLICLVCLLDLT